MVFGYRKPTQWTHSDEICRVRVDHVCTVFPPPKKVTTFSRHNSEDRSSKGRLRWGYWEGLFPSGDDPLPTRYGIRGSVVSSPSGVRDEAPTIWRCKTFYRLTNWATLVSISLILNLFHWNFRGVRPTENPATKFFWGFGPHRIGTWSRGKTLLSCTSMVTTRACGPKKKPVALIPEGFVWNRVEEEGKLGISFTSRTTLKRW